MCGLCGRLPRCFLLAVIFIGYKKHIAWNSPSVLATGTTFMLFSALHAVLNPLLGISIDWDWFCAPAVPLLFFLPSCFFAQIREAGLSKIVAAPVIGLCLLCIPAFYVHSNSQALSDRLVVLGKHTFKRIIFDLQKILSRLLTKKAFKTRTIIAGFRMS